MSVKIQKAIGLVVLLMTGAVQAEVVGLNTFTNEYVGSNVTVTLSQAATNGFKIYYDTFTSGNTFAIAAAEVSGGPRRLAIGDSAVLSFTYNAKASTLDLGFRWGFDFGDTVLQMRADTASSGGVYGSTFLQETYITANGSTTNMSAASGTYANFALPLEPASNYWFKTGNSNIVVTTTVTRVAGNTYTIDVVWGGNTYSSTNTGFSADGTIDSVFFGNGKDTGGGVAANDNFTISDVTLDASPVSEFLLTVNSGTGSGWYTNGQQVAIAPDNLFLQAFAAWTGNTQYLGSAASVASNTVIMPANPVTLTATYQATAQYSTLGLDVFSNEYVGTYSVALSDATTNGFKETYTATNTGNTFVMASAGVSGGPFTLDVGKSAVLTYQFTGGRVATLDLAWRWGFDFGDTAIQMRADTCSSGGTNAGNFLNMGFVTANGALTNASSGTLKSDWSVATGPEPASAYWFKTYNTNVAIQTTVTRNSATNYTISVLWGGNTYEYTTNAPTLDGTIDSVYFGYGRSVSGGVAVDDNFTVSSVMLYDVSPLGEDYPLTGSVSGGNGTVTPSSTNVAPGGSATFVVTADSYYRIASLTTNGISAGTFDNNSTATNFTWSNVQSTGAVIATFTAQLASDPAATPYWWLAQYGLTNFEADAVADTDSDGHQSWQEYLAGTVPTNNASVLKVLRVTTDGANDTVKWLSSSGVTGYNLVYKTNLMKQVDWTVYSNNIAPTVPTNTITLTRPGQTVFYKVTVTN